jgi:hypothetical protein
VVMLMELLKYWSAQIHPFKMNLPTLRIWLPVVIKAIKMEELMCHLIHLQIKASLKRALLFLIKLN